MQPCYTQHILGQMHLARNVRKVEIRQGKRKVVCRRTACPLLPSLFSCDRPGYSHILKAEQDTHSSAPKKVLMRSLFIYRGQEYGERLRIRQQVRKGVRCGRGKRRNCGDRRARMQEQREKKSGCQKTTSIKVHRSPSTNF